ncbi:family 1 glycosylhydrolase [Nakamurella aerolata]|uniref:family 1 glycosylhydrolase n=1 Tax=Nakamurella aerolata TaxID=1656892 RepID=UPI001BB161EB|nr:family 1 glycosylhydrolase [Nakamurella aerolata]
MNPADADADADAGADPDADAGADPDRADRAGSGALVVGPPTGAAPSTGDAVTADAARHAGHPGAVAGFRWRTGAVLRGVLDPAAESEQSVVDVFAAAGRVVDASTPVVVPTELNIAEELGVRDVRIEVPWAGLRPAEPAATEAELREAAARRLAPYERTVDQALQRGVRPWITLYRNALPLSLMLQGGWLHRDTAARFGDFAAVVAERLGDRVAGFITLEEPALHVLYGYDFGIEAPGLTLLGNTFPAVHHLLLGHAAALSAVRATSDAPVGILNHHSVVRPASDREADMNAANHYDALHNGQFRAPLTGRPYPEPTLTGAGAAAEVDTVIRDGDLAAIAAPVDFYGVGYDHPRTIAAAPDNARVPFTMVDDAALPHSEIGWPIDVSALDQTLRFAPSQVPVHVGLHGYGTPAAGTDGSAADADLVDTARGEYLGGHLDALAAADRPIDVVWLPPIVDDWRGSEGFGQRFGTVRLDPATGCTRKRASFDELAGRLVTRNAEAAERSDS